MRAIKVYCPPGVEPPLYAFIDALDGKLKATPVHPLPCRRRAAVQEPLILSLLKVRKNPHLCKTRRICISRTVNSAVLEPQRALLQKRRK